MRAIEGCRTGETEVRGLRFRWLEWGERGAPPLVLLHGLTGHAHTWDHVAPQLLEHFHVFAPDQRGHGDTAHAQTYTTQDFVDDLEALADEWNIGSFVLAGLSMGGHNAMAYAAAHPERVSKLVVMDIPPRMDRRLAPNWDVISKLAETGHRRYETFEQAYADARNANRTAPDANLRYRTKLNLIEQPDGTLVLKYDPNAPARWQPADLVAAVPTIEAQTLFVRGELSEVISRDAAERTRALFRDAELAEVAESGHSLPTDRPESLSKVLLAWLSGGQTARD